ncbi:helix-turn-helix domain-containing protein [Sporosarcina jeotgali]|uniref:Helix-turn-helix domain-containing protein n=1 Tax=Sporosarcina jeotgali TaxID=3020056 RepID=A0ABZ0KU18_9BACL|nr:helix-turn-helix domain-containing protein [Sporosarcina sp. B2O-1]WOV83901.1 helix-turn-helix domain-containing protein [Sporosarcina sp. B2O-1]
MHELLEVSEVARLLKVNPDIVCKLIKSGQLMGLKLGRMKVSTIEIEDFLQRNAGKDLTDPYNVKKLEGAVELGSSRRSVDSSSDEFKIFNEGSTVKNEGGSSGKPVHVINLYAARRELGIEQKALAKLLNIHWTSYSRKERGVHDFTLSEAKKLAEYFNCTLNDLFQDD